MEQINEIGSIEQYCGLSGQRYLHPGVAVIPSGTQSGVPGFKGDFYTVYLRRAWCGNTRYGCGCHDFTTATMVFKSPGEVVELSVDEQLSNVPIVGILFAPELLNENLFDDKRKEYTFFDYWENESLHLSVRELQVIVKNMKALTDEMTREQDNYTPQLLCEHLALLLDHCLRFYRRQFILRTDQHAHILLRARKQTEKYFQLERTGKSEQGAVEYVRSELPFSASYLDDLLRTETSMALSEYIRTIRLELTKKEVGYSDKSFSQIAVDMGFPSLQALNYLFLKLVGCSLREYRQALNDKLC